MKIGIVILLILGLIAAACAALLMGTLKISTSASVGRQTKHVEVAMAKTSLNAGTRITQSDIDTETVARDELPQGKLVGPLQIIGRVLAMPVVEGQVLTDSLFIPDGTPAQLASQIPEGMRAFTVTVSSRAMPDRILLYPGCVVDVLVEYKLPGRSQGDALSQTMLRGIRVLAISGDTVISNTDEEEGNKSDSKNRRTSRGGGTRVSLLVEPKQAEALQLAVENGTITMSLRNPSDKHEFVEEGSVLNRSTLLRSGATIPPTVSTTIPEGQDWPAEPEIDTGNPQEQRITSDNQTQGDVFGTKIPVPQFRYPTRPKSRWPVEVIRGREKKIEEFDNPENNAEKD
jgi:pilus assembly protein CpaB